MKEFTKSFFSYSLAVTLFGLKQLDYVRSSRPLAIASLDKLTTATTAQLGETLTDSFHVLDHLQRGIVELVFPFEVSQPEPLKSEPVFVNERVA